MLSKFVTIVFFIATAVASQSVNVTSTTLPVLSTSTTSASLNTVLMSSTSSTAVLSTPAVLTSAASLSSPPSTFATATTTDNTAGAVPSSEIVACVPGSSYGYG